MKEAVCTKRQLYNEYRFIGNTQKLSEGLTVHLYIAFKDGGEIEAMHPRQMPKASLFLISKFSSLCC